MATMKTFFLRLLVALALFSGIVWSPGGSASAQTFVNLHSFVFTNGTGPVDTLIISSNTLYGTTRSYGGGIVNDGFGTVFRLNLDGSGFTNVYTFTGGTDGGNLNSSLILSGKTLYGTATFDGGSNHGCVFGISTGGTGLTNVYSFSALDPHSPAYTNSDGAYPQAGLVLSGGTLYGTAYEGGTVGWGTIFAVNTNGGSFTNLHSFAVTDGQYPVAPLIQSGSLLYGTTADGGNAYGTLFAIGTNGQGFTNFYNFTAAPGYPYTNSDGANPLGGLVISGSTLYGTASDGGGAGDGTVFKINTDGTGYLRLHDFSGTNNAGFNTDGAFPQAGLVLSGNELYGTAMAGGSSGNGTVFMLDTNGQNFITLHSFTATNTVTGTNADGQAPIGGLVMSGNALYGTTSAGGAAGYGTVYAIVFPPSLTIARSGTNVILTWPTDVSGFSLQSATNLVPPVNWTTVSGQNTVTNPGSGHQKFFRLTYP